MTQPGQPGRAADHRRPGGRPSTPRRRPTAAPARCPRGERVRRRPGARRGADPDLAVHGSRGRRCPRIDRSWSSATSGGRSAAVTGVPRPDRTNGRGQRGRRDDRLGTCRPAGAARSAGPGRGRPPDRLTPRPRTGVRARSDPVRTGERDERARSPRPSRRRPVAFGWVDEGSARISVLRGRDGTPVAGTGHR